MIDCTFLTAGKAIFTVDNGKGEHYTYKVSQSKDGRVYFVSMLTGPDNSSSYTYLGLLNLENGRIRLTAKSGFGADSKPVKVVQWAVGMVWYSDEAELPPGYSIRHAGRCGRCGRLLTVPASIKCGFGPVCAEELGVDFPDEVEVVEFIGQPDGINDPKEREAKFVAQLV